MEMFVCTRSVESNAYHDILSFENDEKTSAQETPCLDISLWEVFEDDFKPESCFSDVDGLGDVGADDGLVEALVKYVERLEVSQFLRSLEVGHAKEKKKHTRMHTHAHTYTFIRTSLICVPTCTMYIQLFCVTTPHSQRRGLI
jgi:hypothetical protein